MGVSHYASSVLSVWYRVTIQIGTWVEFRMLHYSDWGEDNHSSSPVAGGFPNLSQSNLITNPIVHHVHRIYVD